MQVNYSILVKSVVLAVLCFMSLVSLGISPTEPNEGLHFSTSPIISGTVSKAFNDSGSCTFSFSSYFPATWSDSSLVPFEFNIALTDNTVTCSVYCALKCDISLFDSDDLLMFHDSRTVYFYHNSGYQFLDQLLTQDWNFSSSLTNISAEEQWSGIVFLEGLIKYDSIEVINSSNSWEISYSSGSESISLNISVEFFLLGLFCLFLLKRKSRIGISASYEQQSQHQNKCA